MEQSAMNVLRQQRYTAQLKQMRKVNDLAVEAGNILTEPQMQSLIQSEAETLRAYGRLEFGEGILPRLMFAFYDSAYIPKNEYFQTLDTLQELFYAYHNDMNDMLTDDELIEAMLKLFHGKAQGSLEYMENISTVHLVRALNDEDMEDEDD